MNTLARHVDTSTGELHPVPPRRQLADLARPFPRELVERDPGGNSYVAHENVTQWLLGIVGPFSFELVEIIRGDVPGAAPDPQGRSKRAKDGTPDLHQVIVGGVWRLCLQVDGRPVRLEEAGDVEDPHNWRHDGMRLKQAASDAIKRCAMRAGLGLHLWAGERYVLGERLAADASSPDPTPPAGDQAVHPLGVRGARAGWRDLAEQQRAHADVGELVQERGLREWVAAWIASRGYGGRPWPKGQLDQLRDAIELQLAERSGVGASSGPPAGEPAPAAPSGEGASSPAPSPAEDASAAGASDTGVDRTAGQEPPDVEAQTAGAAAPPTPQSGRGTGGEAPAAASTDLSGVGPVTAWCLRRELSPGTVRLYLARQHPAEFGRQGTWPVGNVSELDALRGQAADRAVELAAAQFPNAGPRGWEGGGG